MKDTRTRKLNGFIALLKEFVRLFLYALEVNKQLMY